MINISYIHYSHHHWVLGIRLLSFLRQFRPLSSHGQRTFKLKISSPLSHRPDVPLLEAEPKDGHFSPFCFHLVLSANPILIHQSFKSTRRFLTQESLYWETPPMVSSVLISAGVQPVSELTFPPRVQLTQCAHAHFSVTRVSESYSLLNSLGGWF